MRLPVWITGSWNVVDFKVFGDSNAWHTGRSVGYLELQWPVNIRKEHMPAIKFADQDVLSCAVDSPVLMRLLSAPSISTIPIYPTIWESVFEDLSCILVRRRKAPFLIQSSKGMIYLKLERCGWIGRLLEASVTLDGAKASRPSGFLSIVSRRSLLCKGIFSIWLTNQHRK